MDTVSYTHLDAHACSSGNRDQQVLDGERHGDRGEGRLIDHGNKDTVHDIIQGLDQHGNDHGQGHGDQ